MGNELLALNIGLRISADQDTLEERTCPEWWGRAVQGCFLNAVAAKDEALAASLHAENQLHPYTASSLLSAPKNAFPEADQTVYIRITSLSERLSYDIKGGIFEEGQRLDLDYIPFVIQPVAHDWLQSASFADLVNYGVNHAEEPRLHLSFRSPLVFKTEGRSEALPLPHLVYGSLLRKWNAFSPISFPEEVLRYAGECLGISQFNIRSVPIPLKQGGLRIGAVGEIRYRALNRDKYWLSMLHSLTAFAAWSGIGSGTAYGLGQVRF